MGKTDRNVHTFFGRSIKRLLLLVIVLAAQGYGEEQAPENWVIKGRYLLDYQVSLDIYEPNESRPCTKIESTVPEPRGMVNLTRSVPAEKYLDKKFTIGAEIKTAGVENWAGLWIRTQGQDKKILAYNDRREPFIGTSDWKYCEVALDIPPDTHYLTYGLILNGKGQIWFRDLKLNATDIDWQALYVLEGTWTGSLEIGPMALRIVFIFEKDTSSRVKGFLISPDQSEMKIPMTTMTVADNSVALTISPIGGAYKGQLNPVSRRMEGTWTQGNANWPLNMVSTQTDWKLPRPQTPKPPFPYLSEEVVFKNEQDQITLAGTLTRPNGNGPFPAAILVSGSGPQDRDETLFEHKPFAVIADVLSRCGYAVLRYDDRGYGDSTGNFMNATSEDFSYDAEAALDFLKTRPAIDPGRIGIIGHSEGGIIAMMMAARREDLAFAILLAAPGVSGEQIALTQSETFSLIMGFSQEFIEKCRPLSRESLRVILSDLPEEEKKKQLDELEKQQIALMGEKEKEIYHKFEGSKELGMAQLKSPWVQFALRYDPAHDLRRMKCPVLALNGQLDKQVLASENLPAIEKYLKEGGNTRVEVKELKGLNHLFQSAVTGDLKEYVQIEETFSPSALSEILTWLNTHISPLGQP